jgi:hypothetical protein
VDPILCRRLGQQAERRANWQTEAFLKARAVPLNYSAADLAADNATLENILARS